MEDEVKCDLAEKGWVVESGENYSCDYALYSDTPGKVHSTYLMSVGEQAIREVILQVRIAEKTRKKFVIAEKRDGEIVYTKVERWKP
ncbi:MAG: tRNA-intron endonuclease [Amphiamblys sp. WSBS2006]|nr:MAG: tRNA-intron endonuclease [Amphiamblys sp. WSBS2006]